MKVQNLAALAFRAARKTCGAALLLAAFTGVAHALPPFPPAAPEIDPGSAMGALALMAAGVFMLTDRWRRKK